jgi:hypothetical protein
MTEPEARVALQKWRKYAIAGDPKEPDYGDGKPAGLRAISAESKYRSPQHWEPPEADLEATKEDYDRVEAVFDQLTKYDQRCVGQWYFGVRPYPTPRHVEDAVLVFKAGVMRL